MSPSEYTKQWREEFKARDPEGYRAYRAEEARKHRIARPGVRDAAAQRWKDRNPEKAKAIRDAWKERHPGYFMLKKREENNKYPLRSLVHGAKVRAKKWGLEFDLRADELEIPEICPVLGIPISRQSTSFNPNSPSLDRIFPDKGYTKDNVRVISYRANELKRDATLAEMEMVVAYMRREMG